MELITLGRAAKQAWDDVRRYFQSQDEVSQNEVLELYARAHTVYNCANVRAQNVARVPMRAVDERGYPITHEVNAVFANGGNYIDVVQAMELALSFVGHTLVIPQTNFLGQFVPRGDNLRWVNPYLYTRIETPSQGLVGFRFNRWGTGHEPLNRPDIPAQYALYMSQFDFRNDFDGVGWAEVAFFAGSAQHEKWQTVYSYFVNRAVPATILQDASDSLLPMSRNMEAPAQLQELLDRLFKGSRNNGKTLVSPNRLEYLRLQQNLGELALEKLSPEIRKAIHDAAQVPEVLANFNAATYDNADAAIQFWLRYWLVPRCEWYARKYSQFFSQWYNEPLTIKPDFSDVLEGDDQTERINAQVNAGYMDLHTAQVEAGLPGDLYLKGLYLVPGFGPVPGEHLRDFWQIKAPVSGVSPVALSIDPTQPLLLNERNPFVPDPIFDEIRTAARKGAAFVPDKLPASTAVYITVLRELGIESDTLIRAAKTHYVGVNAAKAIQSTRLDFEQTFEDILNGARSGDIDRRRFSTLVRGEIKRFIRLAFLDGLRDGGIEDAETDAEDEETIAGLIDAQSAFVTDLGDVLFKGEGISDEAATQRPAMWFNKSIYPAYTEGLMSAAANGYFEWVYGDTEHCSDCLALNGQVHRMRDYQKSGWLPKAGKLKCNGFNCACALVPRPGGKASGRFPRAAAHKAHSPVEMSICS